MLKNIAPKAKGPAVPRARKLRHAMSLPEVLLWQALRARPSGLKFRRQHASGPYILDFFGSDGRLAIEIDGEGHSRGDHPAHDAARDEFFKRLGIRTLRILAVDVLRDLDVVMRWIEAETMARLSLHHPAMPGGPHLRDKLGKE